MPLPILQTKLFLPRPRANLVPRTALMTRLLAAPRRPLTLISAPAGFGKTTLISDWSRRYVPQPLPAATSSPAHPSPPVTFCWLALDENDNNANHFLSYVIAALQTADAKLGTELQAVLQTPQPPPLHTLLTYLINELEASTQSLMLVLDDYHLITTAAIHEALIFLVENLPSTLHLVITTRVDPPLPLARWRVRNQLTEVRAGDLRFTTDEAARFLNDLMGLALSATQIATLGERTEGWIAALQLAALSMQGRQDQADFVAAFSGSNRFIVDYLAEEVWQRLPTATQQFLMQTALLDRVCADLGEVMTGQANVQSVLAELDQANLFLIALDDERHWYRYHHLFRDLLLQRLHTQCDATAINELHQRAAQWYAEHALTDEAIQHYLAAAAIAQAADLIEAVGYQAIGRGYLGRLGMWLDKLPLDLVRSRPRLVLWQAWVLNLTGQPARLEQWLQEAEITLQSVPAPLAQDLRAQLTTLHAYRTRQQGDFALAIAQLQQALADCAPDNLLTRTAINLNLGFNYWMTGQLPLAEQALIATQREASLIPAMHMVLLARGTQANVAVAQGKLRAARQLCEATIQSGFAVNGGQPFPSTGYAYAVLGTILYEQNDLTRAEAALRQALDLGEMTADGTVIRRAIFGLAPLCQLAGDGAAAQLLWQRAIATHDTVEDPQVVLQQVRAWLVQATVAADQDALTNAVQWATHYRQQPNANNPYRAAFAETLIARIELLQGQPAQTLQRLAPLIGAATAAGQTDHLLQMCILQTLAHAATGDTTAAHTQLLALLNLTAPEGYIRLYADAGEPMRQLLSALRTRWASASDDHALRPYVDQLGAAFGPPPTNLSSPTATVSQATTAPNSFVVAQAQSNRELLIEPLSEREQEILRLVADGLSNNEIAGKLIVTVGTVKKHLNNIFGKLGVGSRTQAIARARELHLLV